VKSLWILGALALVVAFGLMRVLRKPASSKLEEGAHLAELARQLLAARVGALARVEGDGHRGDGDRADETDEAEAALERGAAFVTSQGVGLLYAIAREGEAFEHRLSMSHRGRVMGGDAAATLLSFVRRVLFPGGASCGVGRAPGGVCMLVATLDRGAHEAFAAAPPPAPDEAACARLVQEARGSKERASLVAGLSRG